jgi:tRNA pseudouridine38-40 synthase
MRQRLRATVEYDGTEFSGFQIQARGRTVQGEIERALRQVSGTDTRVVAAGRTDRGVHAQGQVIAFEVEWKQDWHDLQRALNAVLAGDVAIRDLQLAGEGFHPRFSARSRSYRYTVLNEPGRRPLARRCAWHVAHPLDVGRMAQASRFLIGTHDFATFGRPLRSENTVRTVFRAEWQEQQPLLSFDIEADAFLNRMVRNLVGSLILVGQGYTAVDEFEGLLQAADRSKIRLVAPAHGLCLMRVDYAMREGVVQ